MKPTLIIMVGLIGMGKSTLSQALSERLGAAYLSSDIIRKRLAGIPGTEHHFGRYGNGIYSPHFSRQVYAVMFTDARKELMKGNSVVLDASFAKVFERKVARDIADLSKAGFIAVECRLGEKILKERLANRKDTASDGRWEIYLEQKKVFEPVAELPPEEHVMVDTAKPMDEIVKKVLAEIKRRS